MAVFVVALVCTCVIHSHALLTRLTFGIVGEKIVIKLADRMYREGDPYLDHHMLRMYTIG